MTKHHSNREQTLETTKWDKSFEMKTNVILVIRVSWAASGSLLKFPLYDFKDYEQPTVQGWILHHKDFWENFHISGFLCHKFIVLLSDFTLLFDLSHLR